MNGRGEKWSAEGEGCTESWEGECEKEGLEYLIYSMSSSSVKDRGNSVCVFETKLQAGRMRETCCWSLKKGHFRSSGWNINASHIVKFRPLLLVVGPYSILRTWYTSLQNFARINTFSTILDCSPLYNDPVVKLTLWLAGCSHRLQEITSFQGLEIFWSRLLQFCLRECLPSRFRAYKVWGNGRADTDIL